MPMRKVSKYALVEMHGCGEELKALKPTEEYCRPFHNHPFKSLNILLKLNCDVRRKMNPPILCCRHL